MSLVALVIVIAVLALADWFAVDVWPGNEPYDELDDYDDYE